MTNLQELDTQSQFVSVSIRQWKDQQCRADHGLAALIDSTNELFERALATYHDYCQRGSLENQQYTVDEFVGLLHRLIEQGSELLAAGFDHHVNGQTSKLSTLKGHLSRSREVIAECSQPMEVDSPSESTLREIATRNQPPAEWHESPEEDVF